MRVTASRTKNRNRLLAGTMAICTLMALAIVPALARSASASASGSATWTVDGGPAGLGEQGSNSVACPTSKYCIELPPDLDDLNTYIWNAGSWTTASLVNPGGNLQMDSISCTSSSFCMAGGFLSNQVQVMGHSENQQEAIIETWNGSAWTEIANPEADVTNSIVEGVSCTSTTSCVVVGNDQAGGAFVESWNDSSWVKELSDSGSALSAVSCASTTSCVAVGTGSAGLEFSVVLSNGTWTAVPVVNPGNQNYLYSVSCPSATFCVAVGSASFPDIGWGLTLIEIWNGTSWLLSSSPNPVVDPDSPGGAGGILMSVACASTAACVAVGYGQPIAGVDANGLKYPVQAIVETWDGTGWSITPTPTPIDPDGEAGVGLYGDACAPTSGDAFCMAVGNQNTGASQTAMVLESSAAIGSLSPTSTQLATSGSEQLTVTVSPTELASPRQDTVMQAGADDAPTGSVTFLNEGAAIADCPPTQLNASDQAVCTASGSGPFTAVYSGDATYDGSAGGTDDGPPPTTTTTTIPNTSTTTTTTVPNTTTTTTVPNTTTTTTVPATTTTTTVPNTTTTTIATVPNTTTTTIATVPDSITATATVPETTTTTFPNASGGKVAISTAWLRSRIVSVDRMGAIATAVTTVQPGVATVTASYGVKETTVVRHRLTSRTVTKVFDTVKVSVRKGTTLLVLQPTAPALLDLRERGVLDVVERVSFRATGTEMASQTWRVQDRFRQ